MQRDTWTSRLTYILTVAGATIGFGATWRFPYLVGENGGGAYVLVFCIAMILVGIPVILVENVIGRRMKQNSVDAFGGKTLDGKSVSKFWKIVGYLGLCGAFGIMGYYMVLGGWVMVYIAELIFGNFDLSSPITASYTNEFYTANIEHNPLLIAIYTFVFMVINWVILRKGVIDGIEKSVKFLMPTLFLCLAVVIIRNLTLEGSEVGISFYLKPDLSKIITFSPFYINSKLFLMVLGQVFFALSLGFGVMITLSSYLNKEESLVKTAVITGVINTVVAVAAGFMIFPVLFTVGLEPASGPSLVFKTLPVAFSHIPFGNIIAILFFLLLLIAALTTSLTIYQVIINVLEEKLGFSTKKAVNFTVLGIFIFGNIPCVLSYGPLADVRIFGDNIFDAFDNISGNIFFVITAFLCCIYVGWVLKKDSIYEISNENAFKSSFFNIWYYYVKFIVPIIILVIFLSGIGLLKF